jgi:hypothetical protein
VEREGDGGRISWREVAERGKEEKEGVALLFVSVSIVFSLSFFSLSFSFFFREVEEDFARGEPEIAREESEGDVGRVGEGGRMSWRGGKEEKELDLEAVPLFLDSVSFLFSFSFFSLSFLKRPISPLLAVLLRYSTFV